MDQIVERPTRRPDPDRQSIDEVLALDGNRGTRRRWPLAFALVLTWQTGQLAMDAYDFNWKSSTLLEAPLYIPQLAMTVGAMVFVLEVVATALARTPNDPTATQGRQAC